MYYNVTAIRSDGKRYDYDNSNIKVIKIEGIDFPKIEISKEPRGFGDGDIITGIRKTGRDIVLTAMLTSLENYPAERDRIIGFHDAKYTYDIVISYLETVRTVKNCYLVEVNYPAAGKGINPILSLEYHSTEADLFANEEVTANFRTEEPLWHATRVYTPQGLAHSVIKRNNQKTIRYYGTEPTPLFIKIKANEKIDKIKITHNGKVAYMPITIEAQSIVDIDCALGQYSVNGGKWKYPPTNTGYTVVRDIRLFYGDVTISIEGVSGTDFDAEIYYTGRYGGI